GTSCRRAAHRARIAYCVFELSVLPENATLGLCRSTTGSRHGSCKAGNEAKCAGIVTAFLAGGLATSESGVSLALMHQFQRLLQCSTASRGASASGPSSSFGAISPTAGSVGEAPGAPTPGKGFCEPLDPPGSGLPSSCPPFANGFKPGCSWPLPNGFSCATRTSSGLNSVGGSNWRRILISFL